MVSIIYAVGIIPSWTNSQPPWTSQTLQSQDWRVCSADRSWRLDQSALVVSVDGFRGVGSIYAAISRCVQRASLPFGLRWLDGRAHRSPIWLVFIRHLLKASKGSFKKPRPAVHWPRNPRVYSLWYDVGSGFMWYFLTSYLNFGLSEGLCGAGACRPKGMKKSLKRTVATPFHKLEKRGWPGSTLYTYIIFSSRVSYLYQPVVLLHLLHSSPGR